MSDIVRSMTESEYRRNLRETTDLVAQGRTPEHVRETFVEVERPEIKGDYSTGRSHYIQVGVGDLASVYYAYGTALGAEPPLLTIQTSKGPMKTPIGPIAKVEQHVADVIIWPLVAREVTFPEASSDTARFQLATKDRMIALGKTGEGPEVVAWGIEPFSKTDPKQGYRLRVVTKNLAYGKDVVAAGPLSTLSSKLRELNHEDQLTAARLPPSNYAGIRIRILKTATSSSKNPRRAK